MNFLRIFSGQNFILSPTLWPHMQITHPLKDSLALRTLVTGHLEQAALAGKIPLIVVMGPTASGKTALGIALAELINGEIVSADSRQIYRYMDIGTAKPTPAEIARVKHYLVDFVEPDEEYNLARFQRESTETVKRVHQAGKIPLLVGGTGLYISAVVQNYDLPDSQPDLALRLQYERLAENEGVEAVYRQLALLDPVAADNIHPNNLRYVIRALEIARLASHKATVAETSPFQSLLIMIDWNREELYARIERRIDEQLKSGLVEETSSLLARYNGGLPSLSSLGYNEIAQYLRGEVSLDVAIAAFKQHTRNYAKRQLTWFRRFPQVYSIPGNKLTEILEELHTKA